MHELLSSEVGRRELLLGNEAVVRGALEAGVGLVTGYPGTPASEIGDTFAELHAERGIRFEYSVNEKVALELAFGASLTGVRTLTSMKHLGLTYAGDPLSTMPYIGVVGGMVIVSAADPGCLTSPNEQDQRHLGRMMGLPTLDPASPEEARRMTAFAFTLSEACELPVLLRITTRVCHTRAPVSFEALSPTRQTGVFTRNPRRFLPTPANARALRETLERRLEKACALLTASPFNRVVPGEGRRALVTSGAPRNVVLAVQERLGTKLPVLELGAVHPLPDDVILPFLRGHDELLVIEELTPYLEDSLLAMAQHFDVPVRIHGKRDGMMQWPFELDVGEVERRVRHFLGLERAEATPAAAPLKLPERAPVLCAGCLHRNVFFAATSVFGEDATWVNDIGCYTLGANEPYRAGDVLLAMGSSVPLASGIARSTGKRVIAFLGDSTFFHSGIPGLVNAIEAHDDVVVIILDNHVTAMTGFQPNATSPKASQAGRIPAVVRALGVEVAVVDAGDVAATVKALEATRTAKGVSVVVAEGPCAQAMLREKGRSQEPPPRVDPSRCHTCGMSEAGLYCELPASTRVQKRMAVQHTPAALGKDVPRTSPCSLECPLGICIPAYVGAIAAGEPDRALAAVELRAALPSVCSHICHRPCEQVCVHAEAGGESIAINALKRHLTERSPKPPQPRPAPGGAKVAIVGAGPAGLAAARELVKRGYAPTLFDARERPGGMLEYAVPDYRLPRQVLRRDVETVLALGVAFEGGRRLGRDFTLESLRERGFEAVLLALGAQRGRRPSLPGADLHGVGDALAFLEQPPACPHERVLVVGGGDVGIDVARTAMRNGAASVTLAFPEPESEMTGARDTVLLATAEGVRLRSGVAVTALEGDGTIRRAKLAEARGFQRTAKGVTFEVGAPAGTLEVDRVLFATGQQSELSGVPAALARDGWLAADVHGRTATPWLFAAGDVVSGPSTVTAAMAAGVRAAFGIDSHLAKGRAVAPCAAPPPRERRAHARAHRPDDLRVLDAAAARAEASRCLLCGLCANCETCVELLACPAIARDDGMPRIVDELCVSCGACVDTCPNPAIGVKP